MAKIEPTQVAQLLKDVDELERAINTAGNEAREKLKNTNTQTVRQTVPKDQTGGIDSAAWSQMTEEEQRKRYDQLAHIRDVLWSALGQDGPTDLRHIMSSEYASSRTIVWGAVLSFALAAALMFLVITRWGKATGTDVSEQMKAAFTALDSYQTAKQKALELSAVYADQQIRFASITDDSTKKLSQVRLDALREQVALRNSEVQKASQTVDTAAFQIVSAMKKGGATEDTVLIMVILLGALGGSLHLVRSFVMFVGNRQLKRSWLLYYLSMPITGAGLAPLVYMLLRVGLLNPSGEAGATTANLNLIAIYAFAGLTGLFSKTALDKLTEVFQMIFRTVEGRAKDSLSGGKTTSGAAS